MSRSKINQYKGAKKFNSATKKTKLINIAPPPMRGGFRI